MILKKTQADIVYQYKFEQITFNDGSTLDLGPLTVIIGPNNVGKSRMLRELCDLTTDNRPRQPIVIKEVRIAVPNSLDELRNSYDVEAFPDDRGSWQYRMLNPNLCSEHHTSGAPWPAGYESLFRNPNKDLQAAFRDHFGRAFVAWLTTEHRLQLVKDSASQSDRQQAANLLQVLYDLGPATEKRIRALVKRAFGQEIALDFTLPQRLKFRVGPDFSQLPEDPRDAKPIMNRHEVLDEQGDGIRSYVGILTSLFAAKKSVFLIDEPEAFLHPPQAFRIGEFLAGQASAQRQLLIATHSVDVLRGILSHSSGLTIVRIDRLGYVNTFRRLDAEELNKLANDPLLSSARVLDGLFYSGAVVLEGNRDARFYQAASIKCNPTSDYHFVSAENKQTVPRITELYSRMGVRCAGVVDFDVLNHRNELKKQLEALPMQPEEREEALEIQARIESALKATPANLRLENVKQQLSDLMSILDSHSGHSIPVGKAIDDDQLLHRVENKCRELADTTKAWDQCKRLGRAALPPSVRAEFDKLWGMCSKHGLFINPCGELESLLSDYGMPWTSDKKEWFPRAMQLIRGLQVDASKQPWQLIEAVRTHLDTTGIVPTAA